MTLHCPYCKKSNRIPDNPRTDGDYRCGNCNTRLVVPGQKTAWPRINLNGMQRRILLLVGAWVGLAVILIVLYFANRKKAPQWNRPDPASFPTAAYLANGTEIEASVGPEGPGILKLNNKTRQDAAVKLARLTPSGNVVCRYVYVRANMNIKLTRIGEGEYSLLFALGNDWDARSKTFNRDQSYFAYNVALTYDRNNSLFDVTLGPAPNENMKSSAIKSDEFKTGK